jgi:hypothetical protein
MDHKGEKMPNKLETLLRSRKLWAAVSGLVLVVAAALDPAFPLQGEETAALAALLAAYIVGTAIDAHRNLPDAGMVKNRLAGLLASRKFWAAAVGVVFTVVQAVWPGFPLQPEQVTEVIALLAAYILGTAVEDRLITSG